jgi:hypothetical protein
MLFVSAQQQRMYVSFPVLNTATGIMQDSVKDWEEAASTMASIYENSYLTLAASWASDSNGGCYSSTQNRYLYEVHKLDDSGLYARRILPPFPSGDDSSESRADWPLLKRGWVFQERVLAPRVIHFAKEQLFWECDSCFFDEFGRKDWRFGDSASAKLSPGVGTTTLKDRSVGTHIYWRCMIALYTNLEFTYSKDVLPALGGIVEREMRYRKGDVYIAGMWENSLLEDIAFHVHKTYGTRKNSRVPTWSWASIQGPTEFLDVQKLPSVSLVKLDYERTAPANIGYVTNASLRIRGPVFSVRFEGCKLKPVPSELSPDTLPAQAINALPYVRIQQPCDFDFSEYLAKDTNTHLKVLVLSSHFSLYGNAAILLESVSTGEVSRYRRVDAVYVTYRHEDNELHPCTGKYAEKYKNDVESTGMDEMHENDVEYTTLSLTWDEHGFVSNEEIELMREFIDVLPVQEVEII